MKILIISPTPTHPKNAGNRIRIFLFCEMLRKKGFEIHFLYVENETSDMQAMRDYFEGNLYVYNIKAFLKTLGSLSKVRHSLYRKKRRLLKKIKKKFAFSNDYKYNTALDAHYDINFDTYIRQTFAGVEFSHVLTEYVVFSKALENFKNAVKVIDLHDMLTDRYKIYLEKNEVPEFYSLRQGEEAKGLKRADHVIAIQQAEKDMAEKMGAANTEVIGHFQDIKKIESAHEKRLLFIGSKNKINLDGIQHFINHIFPEIVKQDNGVMLYIAGNVAEDVDTGTVSQNIKLVGRYDDADDIYAIAPVVIIPLQYGTGLKIKTVEALSYGKAIVTFDEGIKGLPVPNGNVPYCLLAKTDAEFAAMVTKLLNEPALRKKTEDSALAFMEKYNQQNLEAFNRIFS